MDTTIAIVGAGPAALSCAIAAKKEQIDSVMLDKGNLVNSIINFPTNMTFFSTPDLLEIGGIPFTSTNFRPTRLEAVSYYQRLVRHFGLQFEPFCEVQSIIKENSHFEINFQRKGRTEHLRAKQVIIATGFYDNPNRLNIPGEDMPHVSHYYREPFQHFGQNVVVVGGKNSAVEAALELFRGGARVTMVHRREEIKESVKYWILPDILNRIKEGNIKTYLRSTITNIGRDSVAIHSGHEKTEIPADAVYLLTGYHPDMRLLTQAGVSVDKQTQIPAHNAETLESNIPGLYLAGSIIAGRNANRIFIENSREHGDLIVSDIKNRQNV